MAAFGHCLLGVAVNGRMVEDAALQQAGADDDGGRERGLAVATAACFEIFVIVLFKNKIDF
jgi:hypothetical protein